MKRFMLVNSKGQVRKVRVDREYTNEEIKKYERKYDEGLEQYEKGE